MIEVKNLTKRYGKHTAVDQLSFTAKEGKIYGFLGPNGAGKTTTMNMMTGYLAPSEGTILINGVDIQKEPEKAKQQIGYLPEVPPVYSDMTVYEYLTFAARIKKIPKSRMEQAIEEAMEASRVLSVEDRLIRNLSKGYRQRVGLSQAVIGNPPVLILDEPTAGLDPEQQKEMYDTICSMKKDHIVIISSHILSDIRAFADYIWIIHEGKLVASDTPENLETSMESQQEIELRVEGNAGGIQNALEDLPLVSKVSLREEEGGILVFTILSNAKEDIRPSISRAAVYAGAAVLEMNRKEKTLEDVFFSLTGGEEENQNQHKAQDSKESETVKEVENKDESKKEKESESKKKEESKEGKES